MSGKRGGSGGLSRLVAGGSGDGSEEESKEAEVACEVAATGESGVEHEAWEPLGLGGSGVRDEVERAGEADWPAGERHAAAEGAGVRGESGYGGAWGPYEVAGAGSKRCGSGRETA